VNVDMVATHRYFGCFRLPGCFYSNLQLCLTEQDLELCTERVEQRIALTLLRLLRSAGVKTSEGIYIDIPLGRQNIADYTGTTLYTVSRTLSSWEKRGWIKSSRERVVITDPHSLVQFSETI